MRQERNWGGTEKFRQIALKYLLLVLATAFLVLVAVSKAGASFVGDDFLFEKKCSEQ